MCTVGTSNPSILRAGRNTLNKAISRSQGMKMLLWFISKPSNRTSVVLTVLFSCLYAKILLMLSPPRCFSRMIILMNRWRRRMLSVFSRTSLMHPTSMMLLLVLSHRDIVFVRIILPISVLLQTISARDSLFERLLEYWLKKRSVLVCRRLDVCVKER